MEEQQEMLLKPRGEGHLVKAGHPVGLSGGAEGDNPFRDTA